MSYSIGRDKTAKFNDTHGHSWRKMDHSTIDSAYGFGFYWPLQSIQITLVC